MLGVLRSTRAPSPGLFPGKGGTVRRGPLLELATASGSFTSLGTVAALSLAAGGRGAPPPPLVASACLLNAAMRLLMSMGGASCASTSPCEAIASA